MSIEFKDPISKRKNQYSIASFNYNRELVQLMGQTLNESISIKSIERLADLRICLHNLKLEYFTKEEMLDVGWFSSIKNT